MDYHFVLWCFTVVWCGVDSKKESSKLRSQTCLGRPQNLPPRAEFVVKKPRIVSHMSGQYNINWDPRHPHNM